MFKLKASSSGRYLYPLARASSIVGNLRSLSNPCFAPGLTPVPILIVSKTSPSSESLANIHLPAYTNVPPSSSGRRRMFIPSAFNMASLARSRDSAVRIHCVCSSVNRFLHCGSRGRDRISFTLNPSNAPLAIRPTSSVAPNTLELEPNLCRFAIEIAVRFSPCSIILAHTYIDLNNGSVAAALGFHRCTIFFITGIRAIRSHESTI